MRRFFQRLFRRRRDARQDLKMYRELLESLPGDLPPEVRDALETGPQVDTIPQASGRFGYDRSNPVPVCGPPGELDYLARLRCEGGEPFLFHRLGSYDPGPDGHIVDGYELVCRKGQHRITLYLDMYHAGSSSLVPEGLSKGSRRGFGHGARVESFPEGLWEER
jgi:hypothetical protein